MAFEIWNVYENSPGPVRGVLFDMDGVILDSEKLYARFWMEAAHAWGYPMTWEQALGMRSLNHAAAQQYLSALFGPDIVHGEVRKERIRRMDAYVEANGIEAKPGVYELLDWLAAQGIPAAVTTASPMDRVRDHLGRLGLFDRFDRICTAYDVAHGKPEPDIYLYGAASLGLPPEGCLALEDSYTGILSARRAGCRSVIVPDLDQPGENIRAAAWAKADSLADVIGLISRENA